MPSSTRIPPLLQSSVRLPPEDALLLLTSTLGATANWLLVRFLNDALAPSDGGHDGHNIVLVSWMRDYEFWKNEARKGAGIDLERARKEGRFAFVNGLLGSSGGEGGGRQDEAPMTSPRETTSLPVRGIPEARVVPARGPRTAIVNRTGAGAGADAGGNQTTPGLHTLQTFHLAELKTAITTAVSHLNSTATSISTSSPTQRKTLLILDNPDLLLALNPTITPSAMTSLILTLHDLPTTSHILAHLQSDTPLLSASTPPLPLELAHHNLLVQLAHMSRRVLGVRVLDTGVARDVSGVIRVTEQKVGWEGLEVDGGAGGSGGDGEGGKGREFLYQVKGDGGVKVFERGAGGDG